MQPGNKISFCDLDMFQPLCNKGFTASFYPPTLANSSGLKVVIGRASSALLPAT